MSSPKEAKARMMSEGDLLKCVLDLAKVFGWKTAHFRPARTQHGWRTPVAGDGKGFVDLVLVRPGRYLFIELKSEKGKLSAEQENWLGWLRAAVGSDSVRVLRPSDWLNGEVEKLLT